jgi:hypothetical protein
LREALEKIVNLEYAYTVDSVANDAREIAQAALAAAPAPSTE